MTPRAPRSVDNRWYDDLGDGWWDPRGPVAALHELNPVRVDYFDEVVRRELPEGERPLVLDLGCGGGLVAEALAARGCAVLGLDASLPSLRTARRHARAGAARVAYAAGDAARLPLAGGVVDAVVAADVLEHVDDLGAVLREVARVLRPGGLLLFDTPARSWQTRLTLLWGAELMGWIPRRAHVYERLLTPAELVGHCAEAGLFVRELQGIETARPPLAAAWRYLRRRELGGFRLGGDLRFVFAGYARRLGVA